jgi:hypothetical protein
MKKTHLIFVAVALAFHLSSVVFAATEEGTTVKVGTTSAKAAAPKPKKFKGNITSYWYNFQGTQGARGGLYEFGNTTLRMELMTLQYQATPKLTLMGIGQRLENYVETNIPGFGFFKDTTKGFGDTILSAMYMPYASAHTLLFVDGGIGLPTGNISKKNRAAGLERLDYPYNMQMGSGTYDPIVGVMPMYLNGKFQTGSRVSATIRTGQNKNGYRLGNLYRMDAWADYEVAKGLSPRLVGYYKHKEAIVGADRTLGRTPLTEFYHHRQINWDVSAALRYKYLFEGLGVELAGEFGVPLWQNMDNSDNVVVSTQYYGLLSATGTF